jgi:sulfur-carrier protein adenylyltransferase/sulfurtransferase
MDNITRITKEDLKKKIDLKDDFILLDVRNPFDYANSNVKLPGSIRIPLDELEGRLNELDRKRNVVAYCT